MQWSTPITPLSPPLPKSHRQLQGFSPPFLLCNIEEASAGGNGLPWSPRSGPSQGDPWGVGEWRVGDDTSFSSKGPIIGTQT